MSDLLQHVLALSLVALCVGYVVWQALRTLAGKRSKVGNCCAQGCGDPRRQGGNARQDPVRPQIVYIPVEMLTRKRKP